MFLLDDQDRLGFVSDSLAETLGYGPAVLTDCSLWTLVEESDQPSVRNAVSTIRDCERGATELCQCRFSTAAGTTHAEVEFVSLAGTQSFGDLLGFVREVSGQRAREELETAHDRFGHLFDLIQDAVVEVEIVDMEPVVRSVNPAFEDVFGYETETVLGESLNEFIVPDDQGGEAVDFDQRTADGMINRAVVTRRTERGNREFLYRGIPYDREDGGRYGFAIYSDITEQKRTQQHLQVLHRVLRHNLRNDLTVILGMAEEIHRMTDDPAISRAADCMLDNAERLATLSTKSQTASEVLCRQPREAVIDAAEQTRTVVEAARLEWPEATIETDLPASLSVEADPVFRRAVVNLVENAVSHNDAPTVRVQGAACDQWGVIAVSDDGLGIPEAERAAVFGEADITQLQHGSGLGLWLVKWITESADGKVTHERIDGRTTVSLALPLATETKQVPADD